jgi:chromosome segregation ATPase
LVVVAVLAAASSRPAGLATGVPRGSRTVDTAPRVSRQALIQRRIAEANRSLATLTQRIGTVREAKRRLSTLPPAQRTSGVLAGLRQLGREEDRLNRLAAELKSRVTDASTYRTQLTERTRIDATLTDVEHALAELRRLPPRSQTPYLEGAMVRLVKRRTALLADRAKEVRAVALLEERLAAPLPQGSPL